MNPRRELNEMGEGLCSVPMWMEGCPAGFCDRPAYGERPQCHEYRNAYTGERMRLDGRYNGYVPGLACEAHGGPSERVFRDGNMWCAVKPDFEDIQVSPAGFGETKEKAVAELYAAVRQDGQEGGR